MRTMKLFYDSSDLAIAKKLKDSRLAWIQELGGLEISLAEPSDEGYFFGYQQDTMELSRRHALFPNIRDRPKDILELVHLDYVLQKLESENINVRTPKTWILAFEEALPNDLTFPLFLRTTKTSWKRGGEQSKVRSERELAEESDLLRKAFGWNIPILAREWLELASAGRWMFGDAPQEVRTWIVDGNPVAWSFHYLHAVPNPRGFPLKSSDLREIASMAAAVARPFCIRLMVADFVRDRKGMWHFLEAGPGIAAGTAHEGVFKFVASLLVQETVPLSSDDFGGRL
jgi:hypothetical protein